MCAGQPRAHALREWARVLRRLRVVIDHARASMHVWGFVSLLFFAKQNGKERICFEREGENQRFCPCALARSCPHRSLVEASVRDGLVPACPHEKEKKCGSITQPRAERALNTWLNAGATRAGAAAEARLSGQKALSKAERKSSLHEWGVRANKVRAHARARENTQ